MENNQFDFHLDQLIKERLVMKQNGIYQLTSIGKEYANRMDTDQVVISKQAKISAWICVMREKSGETDFLIYTRLKQPFYGCQGFISGKLKYGEKIIAAAKRELLEETGLTGNPELVNIKHFLVYDKKTNELIEDKFMYLCRVINPKGIIKSNEEGEHMWVNEAEMRLKITHPFEDIEELIKYAMEAKKFDGTIKLFEIDHWSEKF